METYLELRQRKCKERASTNHYQTSLSACVLQSINKKRNKERRKERTGWERGRERKRERGRNWKVSEHLRIGASCYFLREKDLFSFD